MKITGTLTTLSPLQVILPSSDAKLTPDGRIVYDDNSGGFPLTQTAKQKFNVASSARPISVPIIPANTMRGSMRRLAARLITESLIKKGEKLSSIASWQGLQAGAVHGHPDGGDPSISEYRAEQSNVYMGLFGGGPRMHHSAFSLSSAIPITSELQDGGFIPEGLLDKSSAEPSETRANNLITYIWQRRSDDILSLTPSQANVIEDATGSVEAWQTIFNPSKEDKKIAKEAAKEADEGVLRGLKALTAGEFVVPGTKFYFELATNESTTTLAQNGFMLLILREWVRLQKIGASSRHGCGKFAVDFVVDGTPLFTQTQGVWDFTPELIAVAGSMLNAATEALTALSAVEVDNLFQSKTPAVVELMKRCKTPDTQAALQKLLGRKIKV